MNHELKGLVARADILIKASTAAVWQALTDPVMVKQYLFGTDMVADWKVGGSITYRGEWQGKQYEDKGTVLEIQPEKLLVTTYWSSMSGKPDSPENYNTVVYELTREGDGTKLSITQDNNATEESRDHSQKNWEMVLGSIKKMLEI